eukprot:scaffold144415_cov133-Phaeocystis_antarctica.AAC.1
MNTRSQWGGNATERSAWIQPGVGCRTGVALGRASSAGSARTAARSSRGPRRPHPPRDALAQWASECTWRAGGA